MRDVGHGATLRGETDCDFLQRVLSDGEPHNLNEILRRSFAERGCGLTVHSRAADLRKRGLNVANWKDGERGNGSWYRLLEAATARLTERAVAASSGTGLTGDTGAARNTSLTGASSGGLRPPLGEPGLSTARSVATPPAPVSDAEQLDGAAPSLPRTPGGMPLAPPPVPHGDVPVPGTAGPRRVGGASDPACGVCGEQLSLVGDVSRKPAWA